MNNRYICKAKRKDNDEWAEGVAIFADNKAFILNNAKIEFIKGFNENRLNFVLVEVIPETVGQCIGLKDKNGKWIFEGDICEYGNSTGVIGFDDSDAMFTFTYDENIQTDFSCIWGRDLEVIGSIHDNPELLEAER